MQRADWMRKAVGRSVNCWLLIVKAWLSPEWDHTVQQWYNWLNGKNKQDEKTLKEEDRQKLVSRVASSSEGGEGFLPRITRLARTRRLGRRCKAHEESRRKRGNMGKAVTVRLRGTRSKDQTCRTGVEKLGRRAGKAKKTEPRKGVGQVQGRGQQKRGLQRQRLFFGMEA